jgi:hypothetical protein
MIQETTPTISLLSNVEYIENKDLNSFDLWCFKHSSVSLPIYYYKNTYCLCFNCCPGCFEYRTKKRLTESSTPEIYLCCCFSIIYT